MGEEWAITNDKHQPQTCNYFSNRLFTTHQPEPAGSGRGTIWDWPWFQEVGKGAARLAPSYVRLRGRGIEQWAIRGGLQSSVKRPSLIFPLASLPDIQLLAILVMPRMPHTFPAPLYPYLSPGPQLNFHHPRQSFPDHPVHSGCLLSEMMDTVPFLLHFSQIFRVFSPLN